MRKVSNKKDILTPERSPNAKYLPDYAFENVQELLIPAKNKLRVTSHAKSKQKQRSANGHTQPAVNEINVERPLRHLELNAWLVT